MSRYFTQFASPSNPQRKQRITLWKGAIATLEVDWNAVEQDRGTTLSSATWTTFDDALVTLSGAAISGSSATVLAEMTNIGTILIKNAATFVDDSVSVCWWEITIKDES